MTEAAVEAPVHRARRRFGRILREQIAETVASAGPELPAWKRAVEDEVSYLFGERPWSTRVIGLYDGHSADHELTLAIAVSADLWVADSGGRRRPPPAAAQGRGCPRLLPSGTFTPENRPQMPPHSTPRRPPNRRIPGEKDNHPRITKGGILSLAQFAGTPMEPVAGGLVSKSAAGPSAGQDGSSRDRPRYGWKAAQRNETWPAGSRNSMPLREGDPKDGLGGHPSRSNLRRAREWSPWYRGVTSPKTRCHARAGCVPTPCRPGLPRWSESGPAPARFPDPPFCCWATAETP